MMPASRIFFLLLLLCGMISVAFAQERTTTSRSRNTARTEAAQPTNQTSEQNETTATGKVVVPQLTNDLLPDDSSDALRTAAKNNTAVRGFALSSIYPAAPSLRMLQAMESRLGIPYRYNGADDSGYDCSGFVWRVFQEAGLNFERSSARNYWASFPEATEEEARMFGTLVFFSDLGHVGIVRDATSFYHSSTSQGITVSSLTGYWANRIVGFRRVPFSSLASPAAPIETPESGELIDATDEEEIVPAATTTRGKKGKPRAERNDRSERQERFRR